MSESIPLTGHRCSAELYVGAETNRQHTGEGVGGGGLGGRLLPVVTRKLLLSDLSATGELEMQLFQNFLPAPHRHYQMHVNTDVGHLPQTMTYYYQQIYRHPPPR